MNALQDTVQIDLPQAVTAEVTSHAMHGPRLLLPQEIEAVAGGPEASVGSGINPP
jgi:hypothetical protein